MDCKEIAILLDSVKREIRLGQELLNFLQQQEYGKVLDWFKDLCGHLSKMILMTSKYYKNKRLEESEKNGLLLYLWQIITILAQLINVFVQENEIKQNLWLSRDYTKTQLSNCLEGIFEILSAKIAVFEQPNFLKLMDSALEKMYGIQRVVEDNKMYSKEVLDKAFNEAKDCAEDVLCHSMSIAQVILKSDYVIIRGKVQMVLEVLETLSKEINKQTPNSSMIRLYTDSCCDKLCALERNLNTAVLKLTLKVFTEFSLPLEQICKACNWKDCQNLENSSYFDTLVANFDLHVDRIMQIGIFAVACSMDESQHNIFNTAVLKLNLKVFTEFSLLLKHICKSYNSKDCQNLENSSHFDTLVANFDLHVDRIMQIGIFAVACSMDESRSVKIRSCLASLESLETELVPAFVATLKNSTAQNTSHSSLLKGHWLQQASLLKKYIYLIIDPFAFCQIVYLESKQVIDAYHEDLKSYTREKILENVENLLNLSTVLKEFVFIISTEVEAEAEKAKFALKDFLKVLNEVQSAKTVLLSEPNFNPENNLRMLKRCKILLTQIKKLLYCFAEESHQENHTSTEEPNISNKGFSSHEEKLASSNPFLAHIIMKGKQILKDRSVLYKTPQKHCTRIERDGLRVQKHSILKSTENHVFSKSKSLRKLCFLKNTTTVQNVTVDLQITDILNELTNITDTFNS